MESGDIDAGVAQGRRKFADEARLVQIGDVDHRSAKFGIHADALDVHDTRPPIGKHRSRDVSRLPLGCDRHRDQAFIILGHFTRDFLNDDATLLGHDRRGYDVNVAEHRTQQAGKRGRSERLCIHLRDRAFIGELYLADSGFGQLPRKRAQLLGQRDEWLELGRLLGTDRGEIDGVADCPAQEIVRHLLGDLKRDIFLRFTGRGAEMRRADDIGQIEQRIFSRRLGHENVERGAADVAVFKRLGERSLVHQTAARTVDDADAFFHFPDGVGADDVAGLVRQRRVQRYEIGAL